MSDTFILKNQDQLYLTRQGEWVDGRDAAALYHTVHKDEALNQKVELTVRSPELRISVVNCTLDSKGRPQLASDHCSEHGSSGNPEPEPYIDSPEPEIGSPTDGAEPNTDSSEPDTDSPQQAPTESESFNQPVL